MNMLDVGRQKRWRWIGHTLHKPVNNITQQALTSNPEGKKKRGRQRNTWRRDLEADVNETGYSWRELERLPRHQSAWGIMLTSYTPGGATTALID